jgi:Stress responsive A/B Barrel Domain
MENTRRNFITKLFIAAGIPLLSSFKTKPRNKQMKNIFLHHVYFWLNNPSNAADKQALIEGLKKLSAVKTIKIFHIGQPADTNRDVIERGYAISWFVQFDNGADQASYQTDPIHLNFVDTCKHLWSKVIVYDSVDV